MQHLVWGSHPLSRSITPAATRLSDRQPILKGDAPDEVFARSCLHPVSGCFKGTRSSIRRSKWLEGVGDLVELEVNLVMSLVPLLILPFCSILQLERDPMSRLQKHVPSSLLINHPRPTSADSPPAAPYLSFPPSPRALQSNRPN